MDTKKNIKVNDSGTLFVTNAHNSKQLNILGTVSSPPLSRGEVFSWAFPSRPATLALL